MKFKETGKLIQAAHDLDIRVMDDILFEIAFPYTSYFTYGTRPFVRQFVEYGDIFSKQEYVYDFSFLLSTKLTHLYLLNYYCDIVPAKRIPQTLRQYKQMTVFMRPNSGEKLFDGQVFSKKTLENNPCELLQINPWELVVMARDQGQPTKEYRFFFVRDNEERIKYECCEYLPEHLNDVPENVKDMAKEQAKIIFESIPFGNSFVLDICELDGCLFVLELNSINSSSYYSISPHSLLKLIGF